MLSDLEKNDILIHKFHTLILSSDITAEQTGKSY